MSRHGMGCFRYYSKASLIVIQVIAVQHDALTSYSVYALIGNRWLI
jgi:hypothetical protein